MVKDSNCCVFGCLVEHCTVQCRTEVVSDVVTVRSSILSNKGVEGKAMGIFTWSLCIALI